MEEHAGSLGWPHYVVLNMPGEIEAPRMNWTFLVTSLADSFAWPVSLLIILFMFRASIINLINRLENLKWGDREARFAKEVNENIRDSVNYIAKENINNLIIYSSPREMIASIFDELKKSTISFLKREYKIEENVQYVTAKQLNVILEEYFKNSKIKKEKIINTWSMAERYNFYDNSFHPSWSDAEKYAVLAKESKSIIDNLR